MEQMRIRFWGVRGSIASPGAATATIGGNTSCVEVQAGEERLILDAGTGLRALGESCSGPLDATLLLSHLHWDHIQGLPFFGPLYSPDTRLQVIGQGVANLGLEQALSRQMQPPTFPIRWEDLPAEVKFRKLIGGQSLRIGEVQVRSAGLSHPGGGVVAYRIEWGGRAIVYATDTEHPTDEAGASGLDPRLLELARGADVLIYDSQYTPEEYLGERGPSRVGWGHSTFERGAAMARAAGVQKLVLFHHDPSRNDAAVLQIEGRAQALFGNTLAAREGLELCLGPQERVCAA